ncbi:hypothetical protein [Subtercola boreus]|uniref:hypothetical protein n=1 Tax=Subtercola boreus TaxID=120213 RepID=UPI003F593199
MEAGDADLVLAGGVESMSRAPWVRLRVSDRTRPSRRWPGVSGKGEGCRHHGVARHPGP